MKLITAVIRPEKFEAVKDALFAAQVTGMTTMGVAGHGGEPAGLDSCLCGFHEKFQFEIAVSEPYVQITIDAILKAAWTGAVGDGKIFVRPLDRMLRIRTGEVDLDALTPDPMRFPGILESMVPGC